MGGLGDETVLATDGAGQGVAGLGQGIQHQLQHQLSSSTISNASFSTSTSSGDDDNHVTLIHIFDSLTEPFKLPILDPSILIFKIQYGTKTDVK